MKDNVITELELPGIKKLKSGKVREVFDLGNELLIVATDRISAFDCIMPNGIPQKGIILTQISNFWFDHTEHIIPNHRISKDQNVFPEPVSKYKDLLKYRSMIVKKATPLPIECVVRGYLAGSGWKEYKAKGTVCGIKLPPGLLESSELPEPIFTPSTKATIGHDENITFDQAKEIIGKDAAELVKSVSISIYNHAREYAKTRGIIIADTKFEFGYYKNEIILIDEILTPDSSRFWPADQYKPGQSQPSFDKQYLRDYLETLDWNKQPPAPTLPDEVVEKTRQKYLDALFKLTGQTLPTI
jgi:phosphoribosylaminoimidazole-succinocarboxamide synthase